MLNLEDLIMQEAPNHIHPFAHLEAKQSYLPELREFQDCQQDHPFTDPFFDHPNQHPLSSTFSHLSESEPVAPQAPEGSEHPKIRGRGRVKVLNKSRNETKNIPKNFGKGIISFVEHNRKKLTPLVSSYGFDYDQFVQELRELKRSINTIAQLRQLWTGQKGVCLRIISNLFFRKHALEYIFNSRISSYSSHIKYRRSLWQAIEQPDSFNHIKQY